MTDRIRSRRMEIFVRLFSAAARRFPSDNRLLRAWLLNGSSVFDRYEFGFSFKLPRLRIRWSAQSLPEQLTKRLLWWGTYQHDVLLWIRHLCRKGDTVFDIGAFHGLMTIIASRAVGSRGRVIAFEPNANARQHLLHHIALNRCANVLVEPTGLMEREGEFDFFPQAGASSWNSSFVRKFVDVGARIEPAKVQCSSVDAYVARTGVVPQFMKIDTEGTEISVLLGARETIVRYRPVLLLEFNPDSAASAGTSVSNIAQFLAGLGYRFEMLVEGRYGGYSFRRRIPWKEGVKTWDDLANVACLPKALELATCHSRT